MGSFWRRCDGLVYFGPGHLEPGQLALTGNSDPVATSSRSSLALPVVAFPIRTVYPEVPFQKSHHLSGHFSRCPKIPQIVQVRVQVRFQVRLDTVAHRRHCYLQAKGNGTHPFYPSADLTARLLPRFLFSQAVFDRSGNGLISREQAPNRNEARVLAVNVNRQVLEAL